MACFRWVHVGIKTKGLRSELYSGGGRDTAKRTVSVETKGKCVRQLLSKLFIMAVINKIS